MSTLKKHETYPDRYEFDQNMPRLDKSGWILQFNDKKLDLKIDIMVNKLSELHNSNLLRSYAKLDPRFLKIVHFLKHLNEDKKVNENLTKKNKLNNYSLCLMLIAFMQHEKLLPNLQAKAT